MAHTRQPLPLSPRTTNPPATTSPGTGSPPATGGALTPAGLLASQGTLGNAHVAEQVARANGGGPTTHPGPRPTACPNLPNHTPRNRPFRTDAPFAATPEERQQQVCQILRDSGVNTQRDRTIVLQNDQEPPTGLSRAALNQQHMNQYTGQMGAYRTDAQGNLTEVAAPVTSSSHPQSVGGGEIPPGNPAGQRPGPDGRVATAHLLPGTYEYGSRSSHNNFPINPHAPHQPPRGSGIAPHGAAFVTRDTNHDGIPQPTEPRDSGYGMNIHPGGERNVGSLGCQTVRRSEFPALQRGIERNTPEDSFDYVLVHRPHDPPSPATPPGGPRRP